MYSIYTLVMIGLLVIDVYFKSMIGIQTNEDSLKILNFINSLDGQI